MTETKLIEMPDPLYTVFTAWLAEKKLATAPLGGSSTVMAIVHSEGRRVPLTWTGQMVAILRRVMGDTGVKFASRIQVDPRVVSKWEERPRTRPLVQYQVRLDSVLASLTPAARDAFVAAVMSEVTP